MPRHLSWCSCGSASVLDPATAPALAAQRRNPVEDRGSTTNPRLLGWWARLQPAGVNVLPEGARPRP
jgi:hypothetical protein